MLLINYLSFQFKHNITYVCLCLQKFKDSMGFAIDQNSTNGSNKNYMKNIVPGAHLSHSLYSDIPG